MVQSVTQTSNRRECLHTPGHVITLANFPAPGHSIISLPSGYIPDDWELTVVAQLLKKVYHLGPQTTGLSAQIQSFRAHIQRCYLGTSSQITFAA